MRPLANLLWTLFLLLPLMLPVTKHVLGNNAFYIAEHRTDVLDLDAQRTTVRNVAI